MTSNKSDSIGGILVFLLTGITVCSFTPLIRNVTFLLIFAFCLFVIALVKIGSNSFRGNKLLVTCTFFYIFMCSIYLIIGISSVPYSSLVKHLIFFLLIIIMLLLPHSLSNRQKQELFWFIVLIVVVNILDNIRLCMVYPKLALLVNRDEGAQGLNLNMGSSRFYSGVFFFFMICFFCYLNCQRKRAKLYLLVSIIITSIFIFAYCFKAAIIVFTILSSILLFFARRAKNTNRFIFRLLIPSLLVYLLVTKYTYDVVSLISNVFSNDTLLQRLIFLVDSDNIEAKTGMATVETREDLWLLSINTWLNNIRSFFFGIGDHRVDWYSGQSVWAVGIGQHSDVFDSLARYGLVGLVLLTFIIKNSFKHLLSIFNKQYKLQLLVILLMFLLFGLSKGVFMPDIAIMLFILLPLSTCLLNFQSQHPKIVK